MSDIELQARNPFCQPLNASGLREIWQAETFLDATSIHSEGFERLLAGFELMAASPTPVSRCIQIIGDPGAGKSHLLARLRRETADSALFSMASNPPIFIEAIIPFVLSQIIFDLRRPFGDGWEISSLQAIVLIRLSDLDEKYDTSWEELVEVWRTADSEEQNTLIRELSRSLQGQLVCDDSIAKALSLTISPDANLSDAAVRWLSGSTELTEEELELLQIRDFLDSGNILRLFRVLGKLAQDAGFPIILTVDQLEGWSQPDAFAEFSRLLIELLNCEGWYIVVSLLRATFLGPYLAGLSTPAKERIRPEEGRTFIELENLNDIESKRSLIEAKLQYPPLVALRMERGLANHLFPFDEAAINSIAEESGSVSPRKLMRVAEEHFYRCADAPVIPALPLEEFVNSRIEDYIEENKKQLPPANAGVIANRIIEAIECVAVFEGIEMSHSRGALHNTTGGAPFRGYDHRICIEDRSMRLIVHDVHGPVGPALVNSLNTQIDEPCVFVRDYRIGIGGKVFKQRLDVFRSHQNNFFIHAGRGELAFLHSLGRLLANFRSGDFSDDKTRPELTGENLRKAIVSNKNFREHSAIQCALRAIGLFDSNR